MIYFGVPDGSVGEEGEGREDVLGNVKGRRGEEGEGRKGV